MSQTFPKVNGVPDETLPLAPTPADLRRELEQLVVGDLLGPAGGENETLPGRTRVRDRYLVGMLAPAGTVAVDPERADGAAVNGDTAPAEDSSLDDASAAQPNLFPSSFGFTCVIASGTDELVVTARWGRYLKEKAEAEGDARTGTAWRRHPAGGSATVALADGELGPESVDSEQADVVVRGRAAPTATGGWLVTLFLVNEQSTPKLNKDEAWLFQAELSVAAPDGAAVFVGRNEAIPPVTAAGEVGELQLLDMQYRHHVEFAAGHGVAVHVDTAEFDPSRAVRITTAVVPSAMVAATEAPTSAESHCRLRCARHWRTSCWTWRCWRGSTATRSAPALRLWPTPTSSGSTSRRHELDDPQARLAGHEDAPVAIANARDDRRAAARSASRSSRPKPTRPRPSGSPTTRCGSNASTPWPATGGATDTDLGLDDGAGRVRRPRAPLVAAVPARLPARQPAGTRRPDPRGAQSTPDDARRPAVLPDRRRQDRGVPRAHRLHAGDPPPAGRRRPARRRGRRRRAHALHAAAAHGAAVPARGGADLRLRGPPARARRRRRRPVGRDAVPASGCGSGRNVTPNTQHRRRLRARGRHGAGCADVAAGLTVAARRRARGAAAGSTQAATPRPTPTGGARSSICARPVRAVPVHRGRQPGRGHPGGDRRRGDLPAAARLRHLDRRQVRPAAVEGAAPLAVRAGRASAAPATATARPDLDKVGEREERDSHTPTGGLPPASTVDVRPAAGRPTSSSRTSCTSSPARSARWSGCTRRPIDELASWTVDGRPSAEGRGVDGDHPPGRRAGVRPVLPQAGGVPAAGARRRATRSSPSSARSTDDHPGRLYLGICAHGQRLKSVEMRVFTTLLAAAQRLFERYGDAADPWMTLVGYFSALRELGGAKRLVDDDVKARLRKTDQRGLARRSLRVVQELTSRISSTDIPDVLDQLGERFTRPSSATTASRCARPATASDRRAARDEHDLGRRRRRPPRADVRVGPAQDDRRVHPGDQPGRPRPPAPGSWSRSTTGRGPATCRTTRPSSTTTRPSTATSRRCRSRRSRRGRSTAASPPPSCRSCATPASRRGTRTGGAGRRRRGVGRSTSSSTPIAAPRSRRRIGRRTSRTRCAGMLEFRLDRWKQQQGVVGVSSATRRTPARSRACCTSPTLGAWDEFSCPNSLRETEPTVNLIIGDWERRPRPRRRAAVHPRRRRSPAASRHRRGRGRRRGRSEEAAV